MIRTSIKPELLRWAIERASQSKEKLRARFPNIDQWERGEVVPTFRQIERFAKAVSVPVGYLFLSKPPEESIPIPDLRRMPGASLVPPSPELLDTIYLCQRRQAWYRDYALSIGEEVRSFVGRASLNSPVEKIAGEMRTALNFGLEARRKCPTWTDALRNFIEKAEALGVLVMVSGVVGTNTRRRLNRKEFGGFALADNLSPLVFINGGIRKLLRSSLWPMSLLTCGWGKQPCQMLPLIRYLLRRLSDGVTLWQPNFLCLSKVYARKFLREMCLHRKIFWLASSK